MLQQERRNNAIQRHSSLLAFMTLVQRVIHSLCFAHTTLMTYVTDKACAFGLRTKQYISTAVTVTIRLNIIDLIAFHKYSTYLWSIKYIIVK